MICSAANPRGCLELFIRSWRCNATSAMGHGSDSLARTFWKDVVLDVTTLVVQRTRALDQLGAATSTSGLNEVESLHRRTPR